MYRSASSTRISEDYFNYNTSPPKVSSAMRALSLESSELPLYEPFSTSSEVAKKDKSRLKFGENGVHLIPIILILCAFILWFFSNPDIDVPMKGGGDSIAARLEGLTIEGDVDSDGTQTTNLPLDLGDLERFTKQDQFHKTSNKLGN
ncbi:hypothetical protein LguiA_034707 [Lonicera macranthoides]